MNAESPAGGQSRRTFLGRTLLAATAWGLARPDHLARAQADPAASAPPGELANVPWYQRLLRWGQTNITEADPPRYDIGWWRGYWKRTRVQGVIINAGGIVAYYPSRHPLHYQPPALAGRDLLGELIAAAHADGLVVMARMDSNRAHEAFYRAHPEWFARDAEGKPYRAGDLYVTCIHSGYYDEYLPGILREIIERSHPEGITDNSWAGLGRNDICYCENCRRSFRDQAGRELPARRDWDDPSYRQWIEWSYARRLALWDRNNQVTREAGGPDCVWSGMVSGSLANLSASFRDCREICRRATILMLDHQTRRENAGFQDNAQTGLRLHGVLGWDKLIPESMALYQAGRPTFRLASKPPLEVALWMVEGFAGGIQPWWHHVGAYHEDRRMYRTAEPLLRWHEQNQRYLVRRRPVASVGLVWSQRNTDYYGRDDADLLVEQPWVGWTNALVQERIAHRPVHIDDVQPGEFRALILPHLGALSDQQAERLRRFAEAGGGLILTGETGRCDLDGSPRPDSILADLTGVHVSDVAPLSRDAVRRAAVARTVHSYLRLSPELRAGVNGPRAGDEPPPRGRRHPLLEGFEETDILPFGGVLEAARVDEGVEVLATFIPAFPIYPPETAWMRQPRTSIPALTVRTLHGGGRIVWMGADLDRRYSRDNLPDQRRVLANAVRWAARNDFPFTVTGPGLLDLRLYEQDDRFILHLVNLSSTGMWRAPVEEILPVGPVQVRLQNPDRRRLRRARLLVARDTVRLHRAGAEVSFTVPRVQLHEVVVVE